MIVVIIIIIHSSVRWRLIHIKDIIVISRIMSMSMTMSVIMIMMMMMMSISTAATARKPAPEAAPIPASRQANEMGKYEKDDELVRGGNEKQLVEEVRVVGQVVVDELELIDARRVAQRSGRYEVAAARWRRREQCRHARYGAC